MQLHMRSIIVTMYSRYVKKQEEKILFWTKKLEDRYGPETFATYKAWSSNNTLSGLSGESLLDLGMSLPITTGHNDHEMPPKHGQI